MKPILTILLTFTALVGEAQVKRKKQPEVDCSLLEQVGVYHTIPTVAFSYINENGDLKWQYCDSLTRRAYKTYDWPIDCVTQKRKPVSLFNNNYWYIDLPEYYLHNKIVKPLEIIKQPNTSDYYHGFWDVKTYNGEWSN